MPMEEISRVYADALFGAAKDAGRLDEVHEQLDAFADAVAENREMSVYLFSPYFSSAEKKEGISRAIAGADPLVSNFLELLVEKHRMPAIFRIRKDFDALWAKERRLLEVTVTSAVELDPEVASKIGGEIERQTGQTVELSVEVDPDVLGGLVVQVGNMVLDASVKNRLEKLRKNVATAA